MISSGIDLAQDTGIIWSASFTRDPDSAILPIGEPGASALASQDGNIQRAAGLLTRLRMLINATGSLSSTAFRLEYRPLGGAWQPVEVR